MSKVITASLDDMVFEDREKGYGAFSLRKSYPRHLLTGTLIIGTAAFLLTFAPLIAKTLGFNEVVVEDKANSVVLDVMNLPPPPVPEEIKQVPPPRIPPEVRTIAYQIPTPTPEEEIEDDTKTIAEIEVLENAPNIGLKDKEGEDVVYFDEEFSGDGNIPEVIVEQEPGIEDFLIPDEEPQPVNMEDIRNLIGYPQMARDAGIQDMVVVRVLVDKKGNYSKHKVIKSGHPILETAVVEHINKLRFTPAIQGKKPIQFWVNIPFHFKLIQ
ncbi:MAG: energy transducer TonB [Bacteroidia bacterium]|nr:energy transducer TonB [Bacteroidia bacterium]